jgi:alpha-1,2-mannosyltransferase
MHFYSRCLQVATFLMTNSTWTKNHIDCILVHNDGLLAILTAVVTWPLGLRRKNVKETTIVYPPCDTREMTKFSLESREPVVLSIAQFRYGSSCNGRLTIHLIMSTFLQTRERSSDTSESLRTAP